MISKRLELIKELVPAMSRIGLFANMTTLFPRHNGKSRKRWHAR